jgi:hypothetical protein
LEDKIESQEYVHRALFSKQEYYHSELSDKYTRRDSVNIHQGKVILSQRFQEKTDDTMNAAKDRVLNERLDNISTTLKAEMQQHINRLDTLRRELSNANSRLLQLQTDYRSALDAEEAERRRAEEERLRQLQNQK